MATLDQAPAPPLAPGRILQLEFIEPLGLTASALAQACGIPTGRIEAILSGDARIDADLSLRLGRAFSQSPPFWLNIQTHHDIEMARRTMGSRIDEVQVLFAGE